MSHLYGFLPGTFDAQWWTESERRVTRPLQRKERGKAIGKIVRDFTIEDAYQRLLKRGVMITKSFYSNVKGLNLSDEAVAQELGPVNVFESFGVGSGSFR